MPGRTGRTGVEKGRKEGRNRFDGFSIGVCYHLLLLLLYKCGRMSFGMSYKLGGSACGVFRSKKGLTSCLSHQRRTNLPQQEGCDPIFYLFLFF
jgi:hypothetical protein